MSDLGWNHPIDESDQWDGFNEGNIEHFRGRPLMHLAREAIQNALDAKKTDCVKVEICLHKVDTYSVPDIEELRRNLKLCYEASQLESDKANIFFNNAVEELGNNQINVLEISDYNTIGMIGPSENGTPYYAYMKAKGQSRKESSTAAGSYGIGKFAPYAVSNIRTIFVSTIYEETGGSYKQLTQGKSILISHDENDMRKMGTGFWGIREKCKPVEMINDYLPSWLQRANNENELCNTGTKLTILCFDIQSAWQELLTVSVAENFFGAICSGELEVSIDRRTILNKESILSFFNNTELRTLIEDLQDEPEKFDNSKHYLEALINEEEVIIEESETQELGLVEVRILLGEGLPRKVCVLRNGMFITDRLSRLKSFSDFKEFVAVVQCKSQKGNELLRAMEPPRHDDFEPERLIPSERNKGAKALKDLSIWIRDMLKRHAKEPVSDKAEIDELRDFFYDEGEEEAGTGTEDINPRGEIFIRAKPVVMRTSPRTINIKGSEGRSRLGKKGSGTGNKRGGGSDGTKKQKPPVSIMNIRSLKIGEKKRRVAFTPNYDGEIIVYIFESGADQEYWASVTQTDVGYLKNGQVCINAEPGERCVLNLELDRDISGALKVVAYEI